MKETIWTVTEYNYSSDNRKSYVNTFFYGPYGFLAIKKASDILKCSNGCILRIIHDRLELANIKEMMYEGDIIWENGYLLWMTNKDIGKLISIERKSVVNGVNEVIRRRINNDKQD